MTHCLISSFGLMTCRKDILPNDLGNQAFSFSVNGTAVVVRQLIIDCDRFEKTVEG
jgi:hypothetical protein